MLKQVVITFVTLGVGGAMLFHLAQNVAMVIGTLYGQVGLVLGIITFAAGVAVLMRQPPAKVNLPWLAGAVIGIALLYNLFVWFVRHTGEVIVPDMLPLWVVPAFTEGGLGWVVGGGVPAVLITLVTLLFGLAEQGDSESSAGAYE